MPKVNGTINQYRKSQRVKSEKFTFNIINKFNFYSQDIDTCVS